MSKKNIEKTLGASIYNKLIRIKTCNLMLFILWGISLSGQDANTVGLISYEPARSFEGFNLLYPNDQPNTYLVNDCGEVVHQWIGSPDFRPGMVAYLLGNGDLLRAKRSTSPFDGRIWAGGAGGIVEILSWDNRVLWKFEQNDSLRRLHHDIEFLPNGNVLMISWESKSREEAIQAGRSPGLLQNDELWPDYLLEVNPETDEVVWEWHAWDHLIQDFDSSKDNYGIVANHPERININFALGSGPADWMHTNSIDYNAELDQVLLCLRNFHEVWIIDHSTTTEEAATSSGGNSGKGGDLLFRWGNPITYNSGTLEDQALFAPHDGHWVDDFVDEQNPDYGKIILFNNRFGTTSSAVTVIEPDFDQATNEYSMLNETFLPVSADKNITLSNPGDLFSVGQSSVQQLPNDNYLICSANQGYLLELAPDTSIVWEYILPLQGGVPVDQGTPASNLGNSIFQAKRYPSSYPAFLNRQLDPIGFLESNPNPDFCDEVVSNISVDLELELNVYPNPATEQIFLSGTFEKPLQFVIYNMIGRPQLSGWKGAEQIEVNTTDWKPGVYYLTFPEVANFHHSIVILPTNQ